MSNSTEKERLVECALNTLREHCDAVVILVSWTDADGTALVSRGCGNYYARVGMAKEFIDRDLASTSAHEIKEALDEE
jgi:hypothetical protein